MSETLDLVPSTMHTHEGQRTESIYGAEVGGWGDRTQTHQLSVIKRQVNSLETKCTLWKMLVLLINLIVTGITPCIHLSNHTIHLEHIQLISNILN